MFDACFSRRIEIKPVFCSEELKQLYLPKSTCLLLKHRCSSIAEWRCYLHLWCCNNILFLLKLHLGVFLQRYEET